MSKRKNIRKILSDSFLSPATLGALKQEEDRRQRLRDKSEHQNPTNSYSTSFDIHCPSHASTLQDSYVDSTNRDNFETQFFSAEQLFTNSLTGSSGPSPSKALKQEIPGATDADSFLIEVERSEQVSSSDDEVSISHVSGPVYSTPDSRSASVRDEGINHNEIHCGECVEPTNYLNQSHNHQNTYTLQDIGDLSRDHFSLPQSSFLSSTHLPPSSPPGSHTPAVANSINTLTVANSINILPHLAAAAKPHQLDGLRFLYDNIIEDISSFNKQKGGFGCILAHSMGLGKTFQSISFIELFLRSTASTHILVIVPVNTLHNWIREFDMWLPPRLGFGSLELDYKRPFKLFNISEQEKTFKQRFSVLTRWKLEAGVLIIGYELFRTLVGLHMDLNVKVRRKPRKFNPHARDVFEILCDPGPDLVICDEGHRIKNEEAAISQAIKSIRTRRRIMLTGYPLQNNLLEYWCMIDFVRPRYLGSKKEFKNLFLRPIENGQCQNSMPEDVRMMLQRTHVLHHMLSGIVQRRSEEVLTQNLPPKYEFVVFTSLSLYQSRLYDVIMNDLREERATNSSINPLLAFAICCKIWNHPEILYDITRSCSSASDLSRSLVEDEEDEFTARRVTSKDFYNLVSDPEVIRDCFRGYEPELLENGPKFRILFDILEMSVSMGEKVLVFSQSIPTLNLLELFLRKSLVPNQSLHSHPLGPESISFSHETWKLNYNYLRLDGSTYSLDRHNMITDFNNPNIPRIKLFLISTRAGSLGINLVAASRVIILDVSWNPCHDAQAVCRSYRFGQTRQCFVYRLIADGTFESKMYKRQISKISTSDRVLDQLKPERVVTKEDIFSAITSPVEHVIPIQDLCIHAGKYQDPIMKRLCMRRQGVLTQPPFLHESYFIDSTDDHMNEKERREASEFYINEREMCRQREVYSRENTDVNSKLMQIENNRFGNPHSYTGIEEPFVRTLPKAPCRNGYTFTHYSTPYQYRSIVDPILERTSPISITDSEEELPINACTEDLSPPLSPPCINLVQTPEFAEEPVVISSSLIDSSTYTYTTPPLVNTATNMAPAHSVQEPIIIVLDSPSFEEPKDSGFHPLPNSFSYDPPSENPSQFCEIEDILINSSSNSQSSMSIVEENSVFSDSCCGSEHDHTTNVHAVQH